MNLLRAKTPATAYREHPEKLKCKQVCVGVCDKFEYMKINIAMAKKTIFNSLPISITKHNKICNRQFDNSVSQYKLN